MLNDTYITLFLAAMLVLALLLVIFWIEDKLEAQHAEVLARVDQLEGIDPMQESEAAGISYGWVRHLTALEELTLAGDPVPYRAQLDKQAREEATKRQFNEQCG